MPQWPAAARVAVAAASAGQAGQPDQLVTFGEAVAVVGDQFRHVLHTVAAEVGVAGRVTREYVRRGKPWRRQIEAYSSRALLEASTGA